MCKRKIVVMGVLMLMGQAHALTGSPSETQSLYFEIGGGDAIRDPLNTAPVLNVGVGENLKLAASCDLWDGIHLDLDAYGDMVVDHIEDQVQSLQTAIVQTMFAGVQGYATAALQRAMPGMFDWSMNLNAQLKGKIDVAKMSCESVVDDLEAGNNPFGGWVKDSASFAWMNQIQAGVDGENVNILDAKDNAATAKGEQDIPWLTGEAGGASLEPINLVTDTVVAGYELHAGGNDLGNAGAAAVQDVSYETTAGGAPATRAQRLGGLWPTGQAAAAWAVEVLGERSVSYCAECAGSTRAGKGLSYAAHEEKNEVLRQWQNILGAGDIRYRTIAELRAVSSTKVQITQEVLETLSVLPDQDRALYISRLASDVGVYRTVEKAMAMRRLLQSALTTPEVSAHEQAKLEVAELIDELRREIEDLLFEIETGNRLVSDVPGALIAYREARRQEIMSRPVLAPGVVGTTNMHSDSAE